MERKIIDGAPKRLPNEVQLVVRAIRTGDRTEIDTLISPPRESFEESRAITIAILRVALSGLSPESLHPDYLVPTEPV